MGNLNFCKTGDKCPRSGEWVTLEDNESSVYLNIGDEMPPFMGRSVNWQFKDSINLD